MMFAVTPAEARMTIEPMHPAQTQKATEVHLRTASRAEAAVKEQLYLQEARTAVIEVHLLIASRAEAAAAKEQL